MCAMYHLGNVNIYQIKNIFMYKLYLSKVVKMIKRIMNIFKILYLSNISHLIFLLGLFSNMQTHLILIKEETLLEAHKILLDLHCK